MDRAQAAVFLLRAKYGINHVPPPPVHLFADDWTKSPWAESWAENTYKSGLSSGCSISPVKYCPWNQLPREQMAVLALKLIPSCGTDSASGKPLICPKELVTRGLAAYIIVRAKNLKMP